VKSSGGCCLPFILNPLIDLFAMDDYLLRGINPDPYLLPLDAQHGHADVVIDADGFAYAAGEYQHGPSPWLSSRCPLGEWAEVMLWGVYQHGRSVERIGAELKASQRDSGDRLAEVLGERGARQEEQRRAEAREEVRANAKEEHQVADAGAAGADAAGQRLRDDAAKLAATVSCPATDTAAIARGQATTRAAMVLSDLLARADARAGELAKAYDRARIAGLACERSYSELSIGSRAPL
jgi:hypothetical protein